MFRKMTRILFASLVLSSVVPAGAWALDLTEDTMSISEYEDDFVEIEEINSEVNSEADILTEIDEESEADLLPEIDEESEADLLPEIDEESKVDVLTEIDEESKADTAIEIDKESEVQAETEIDKEKVTESETEIDKESKTESEDDAKDKEEKLLESEAEDTDLFEANTVQDFISRLYKNMLGRKPSSKEIQYWVNQVNSGKSGAEIADGFIHSNEFKSKSSKMQNTDYVEILYNTFLNRKSDRTGMNYWTSKLSSGMSRDYVYSGYVNSSEFAKLCQQYNIKTGKVVLTEARDQNEGVTTFTVRLYRKFLSREADAGGLNYWCGVLLKGTKNAKEVAEGFAFSNEFKAKNTSNNVFIKTLYQTLLNRNADSTGLKYWNNKIAEGDYRSEIFQEFADSNEFRNLTQSYGIKSNWQKYNGERIYDAGKYTLTFSKENKNKYVIVKNATYLTVCEKTNYNYTTAYHLGKLFYIVEYDASKKPEFYGRNRYLGRSGNTDFYAAFPTDVEYHVNNQTLKNNYLELSREKDSIINSFKLKK